MILITTKLWVCTFLCHLFSVTWILSFKPVNFLAVSLFSDGSIDKWFLSSPSLYIYAK